MRWKNTLLLGVVFAVLALFYYVYEVRLGPDRERAARARDRLWAVEAGDVVEVVLRREADTVHIKREGQEWALLAPVRSRADLSVTEGLVANLVTARVDREVDPRPSGLAQFGLDPPRVEVVVRVKGGGDPPALLLGGRSPTGAWVYGKRKDQPAVFTLPDAVLRDAARPAADYRDRTLLAFDRKDVTRLEITVDEERMVAEPGAGALWRITTPVALPADGEAIADLLDKLSFSRVKAFVAERPRSLAPYGLDRPVRVTVVTGTDKGPSPRTLLLGKAEPARQGVYAMRPEEASILLVGEDVWEAVPKTVGALRDKTVLRYDGDRVVRIEVESPKGKVALAREGARWRLTAPEPLGADAGEVTALLRKVREMRAAGFLGQGPGAVDRYLARPRLKVSLWEEGGASPKVLLLSPSPERRGGRSMAYAGVMGQGPVMLVDAAFLRELARAPADLRGPQGVRSDN